MTPPPSYIGPVTGESEDTKPRRPRERFHGRVEREGLCEWPGCEAAGEFRAPREGTASDDGPPEWRWFCLDHVREFNAGYSWRGDAFSEVRSRWDRATSAFAANAYAHRFDDEAGVFRDRFGPDAFPYSPGRAGTAGRPGGKAGLSPEDHSALAAFDLDAESSWADIRSRYKQLVRRYHPDMNGGDRSHERELQAVIDAYTQLRRSAAFTD